MSRKPRADSKLKTLPEELQAELMEYWKTHSLKETREWLRSKGIETSTAALSEFGSWYVLGMEISANEAVASRAMELRKQAEPGISEADLFDYGQRFFGEFAIRKQDSLAWKRVQDARSRRQAVEVLKRRLELIEAERAQATAVLSDEGLSPEQKAQRMREVFGIGI